MSDVSPDELSEWWATEICRIEPDVIEIRGHPVAELIGRVGFTDMIWLLLKGSLPTDGQRGLLEAAMVAGIDHGPQAPSIAIARMAITCGIGLNNAIASGANVLGDVHGGAGEQCLRLLLRIADGVGSGVPLTEATADCVREYREGNRYLPGFGHRIHRRDPRRDPLLGLVAAAAEAGEVPGNVWTAARAVEDHIRRDRPTLSLNVDGATAVIYGELGFEPALARGLFVLSRSAGLLAHAWEELNQGRRIKGPMPPAVLPAYITPSSRSSPR